MEIYNLKTSNYNLRGKIGELIAKSFAGGIRTVEFSPYYFCKNLKLFENQKTILFKHWKSIDLIDFKQDDFRNVKEIIISEVKTISQERSYKKHLEITQESLNAYREARTVGIIVKVIKIILQDNWNYTISIKDFDENDFYIQNGGYYRKSLEIRRERYKKWMEFKSRI